MNEGDSILRKRAAPKSVRLSTPVAPPLSPVAVRVPRPMTIDSAADSGVGSAIASSVRVTSWADGSVDVPVKVTERAELSRLPHATPVGKGLGQETSQSPSPTVPPKVTGTTSASPLTSARFSRTVKSRVSGSGRVTALPSRVAVVASLSVTVTVAGDVVPTV